MASWAGTLGAECPESRALMFACFAVSRPAWPLYREYRRCFMVTTRARTARGDGDARAPHELKRRRAVRASIAADGEGAPKLPADSGLVKRCPWPGEDTLYVKYHDEEWGRPEYDDVKLFEMMILEGAQAGLSWITILRRRENYRRAFDGFEPAKVAAYDQAKVELLLDKSSGIIRHRGKIESAISNARIVLDIQETHGSLSKYLWSFVDGRPITNEFRSMSEVPVSTPESERMSKDLKKKNFKFFGPTIAYAFMQAVSAMLRFEPQALLTVAQSR